MAGGREAETGRVGRLQKCISAALLHPSQWKCSETDGWSSSEVHQEEKCRYIKLLAEAAVTHRP